ncbi:MAG: TonB-dependent receptor [Pseudomonadota bacterium]
MTFQIKRMAAAVSVAMLHMAGASAQDATTPETPANDGLNLERIVVTGTAAGSSKMKSSVSLSTMDMDAVQNHAPTSAADVLRAIPGVRSESSGGEGNANITVRGVPISAGGARYVQIQEDGLPVLQSGDFNFITPDSFVRIDGSLDHLEVVRGGSASVLATNSPGGIINFISKTGSEKGGSVALTRGLDYDSTRLDFDYGMPVSERTRFFVAGFYRSGEGTRHAGVTTEQGGQIRANLTHEFDSGFVRLSFKHLNDRSPTALPVPVMVTNGQVSAIAGIDPRTASFYSPYWVPDVSLGKGNTRVVSNVNDGLSVESTTFGLEASFRLGDGWTLGENFRHASNSGRFIGVFPANNGTVGSYTFATGPSAGQAYNGRAMSAVVFNTSIDDAGAMFNDARLAKTFALAGGAKLTGTAGLYLSVQDLALTWNFNEYLMQASGKEPALLRTASSTPGLVGPAWGGCCSRAVDMRYKLVSPYVNVAFESGPLNIDAGLRQDNQRASGSANIAQGGIRYNEATRQLVDYDIDHTSYSVGANYKLSPTFALFGRVSEGVAFNADRILFGTPLDGSAPISINTVRQVEGGVKWRRGGISTFVTLFQAKTKETNYEATTQKTTANSYSAQGVEIEAAWNAGPFRMTGGLTLTDAEITATAPGGEAVIGNTPRRQARAVYQLAPSYTMGDASFGLSLTGTGASWADDGHTIRMPAYSLLNGYASYQVTPSISLALSASNLLDKIAYTEVEGDGHAARAIGGRSIKATLKYSF